MEPNKAVVDIYGKEYTITGDKEPKDIKRIANFVDEQIGRMANYIVDDGECNVVVLTTVNIAEMYFDLLAEMEELGKKYRELEAENQHYMELWETQKAAGQQAKNDIAELKQRIEDDKFQLKALKDQCDEYEYSFFELQKDNIHLQSELEKLKTGNKQDK